MGSPETLHGGGERGIEAAQEAAGERSKELAKQLEKSGEQGERSVEHERKKVEQLFSKESGSSERKTAHMDASAPAATPRLLTKQDREQSYRLTMSRVQSELSPSERAFSKVIHNKTVERTSDALGRTVARPNAILAGGLTAFVLVALVYIVAKMMGYRLSGFETIGAFILGWILGLVFDYARLLYRGKS